MKKYNKETNPYDVKIKTISELLKGDKLDFALSVLEAAKKRLEAQAILP